ncbi:MAG: hypothetical protein ABSF15_06075 [Candidatus Sulfotelmatobacter sp.]|jgi:hypothetical protein
MLVLSGLRWFDYRMKQEQHRVLYLTTERHEPGQETIRAMVQKAGYEIIGVSSVACNNQTQTRELEFKLQWRSAPHNVGVRHFCEIYQVIRTWRRLRGRSFRNGKCN